MAYTYEDLHHKTVAELRAIAAGLDSEAVKGYTQMNKDHLLVALCEALNIPKHAHHEAAAAKKAELKARLRELKKKREEALNAHDHALLHEIRREIHHIKVLLHRASA